MDDKEITQKVGIQKQPDLHRTLRKRRRMVCSHATIRSLLLALILFIGWTNRLDRESSITEAKPRLTWFVDAAVVVQNPEDGGSSSVKNAASKQGDSGNAKSEKEIVPQDASSLKGDKIADEVPPKVDIVTSDSSKSNASDASDALLNIARHGVNLTTKIKNSEIRSISGESEALIPQKPPAVSLQEQEQEQAKLQQYVAKVKPNQQETNDASKSSSESITTSQSESSSGNLDDSLSAKNAESAEWSGPLFHLFGVLAIPPWVLGVCLGTIGYSLCGLGMNLIRLSHLVLHTSNSHNQLRETFFNKKASRNRSRVIWVLGYGFNTLGGTMNVIGLRFAAQSLMAPLSSMALVSNAISATSLLGERMHVERDLLPMVMVAIGNVVTVLSANHHGYKDLTIEEFSRLFFREPFQLYLYVVVFMVSFFAFLRYRFHMQVMKSGGREHANQTLVAKVGLFHAAAGCILCVHSVFLSKATLLILAQNRDNLARPALVILASGWAALGLFWVYTLNRLLGDYDALFIVPVIEVVWSLQSMICGGIFFNEFSTLNTARLLSFGFGVCINITGVVLLSKRHDKRGQKLSEE
eukprot:CAMPEP_0184706686 /NCGR_PEP_ID=MMETSP0313-20130426/36887_1 /TAXON_ID=2792 /ORGANISM="Porphyridium aerugineum, Strain SAG 1380-2" /LENGTH=582 /DNA_ID=CAMNT_0027168245 /DNA_START=195 /DNA_END=1943 /DNA_ORIENTATION=-